MTVFSSAVKAYLTTRLETIRDRSLKKDNTASNWALSWISLGRDVDFSTSKRGVVTGFIYEFQKMNLEEGINDHERFERINQSINELHEQLKSLCHSKKMRDGKTEEHIYGLLGELRSFYNKLENAQLLDIEEDNSPFSLFAHCASSYFKQKLLDSCNVTEYQKVHQWLMNSENPMHALSEAKENLLVRSLADCLKELADLNKLEERENDGTHRKLQLMTVKHYLEKLRSDNVHLCEQYGSKFNIPVTLTLFAQLNIHLPSLKPKEGTLEECIKEGLELIQCQLSPSHSLVHAI